MIPQSTLAALQSAVDALVPKDCAGVVGRVKESLDGLSVANHRHIAGWAPHRQCEFAAGRLCARRVLTGLGVELSDLLPDRDGVPCWPAGVVGSISHSRGVAMAVVAREGDCALLGLDLEKTNRLSGAAMRKVVHPLEEDFVAGDQTKASILFSLKEAFYKAQFPRWRTSANFHHLALAVDLEAGTARVLELDARFAPELAQLHFAFRLVEDYAVSLCWG